MGGLMRWIHRAVMDFQVPADITADQAVADLRAAGAVGWANLLFPLSPGEAPELHKWGRELADRFPEITPFGGVHIHDHEPLEVVQEAVEHYGMSGLKFHPMVQRFYPWHPRLAAVLNYLDARSLPIYVHTGYEGRYNHEYDRAGLVAMLEVYPNLPVVLSHLCFPDLDWAFSLADRFPQVWLDLTNIPGSLQLRDAPEDLTRAFTEGLATHRDRSLMGTDYPAGMGNLQEILEQFHSVGIDNQLLEHVMLITTRKYLDQFGRPRQ